MKQFAILIAIEHYLDSKIDDVQFAKNDAEAMSDALEIHGFDKANQLLLVDAQATKAAIKAKVSQQIGRLNDDDILYFFYAGRGFSLAGQNFISCPSRHQHEAQARQRLS